MMSRRGIWLVLSALFVSTVATPAQRPIISGAGSSDKTAVVEGGAPAKRSPELDPTHGVQTVRDDLMDGARARYLQEIVGLVADACAAEPAGTRAGREPAWHTTAEALRACGLGPENFVIALAADPVHTHLALQFDRMIETIQQALQDEGYSFMRAVMPWDSHSHPEADDIQKRLAATWLHDAREDLPGLMAFRLLAGQPARNGHPANLFVWVVGETPTGGIRKTQFTNAIEQMIGTRGTVSANRTAFKLRILGPTFSGSLFSLTQLLTARDRPRSAHALVFSGTVSSASAIRSLAHAESKMDADFISFQETDEVMVERFQNFICRGDPRSDQRKGDSRKGCEQETIALLSEDETVYGIGAEQMSSKQDTHLLKLYFPREISQLRAAYQGDDARASGADSRSAPRSVLPLNLEVSGSDDDTVAAFSHRQTPLSQEAVLLGIVSELRKHRVRYIVLRATDPLDLLFLSRYLGAAFPQGRVVTLGADMLFGRGLDEARQLHGVLALSSYSLAPLASHDYQSPEQSSVERIFPSSSEAGAYNALRSLLAAERVVGLKIGRPGIVTQTEERLYQYGWRECPKGSPPVECDVPPVRLLALGHDEYWPVALLGQSIDSTWKSSLPLLGKLNPTGTLLYVTGQVTRVGGAGKLRALSLKVPTSWRVLELAAVIIAFGFALAVWFASIRFVQQPLAQFAPSSKDARGPMIAIAALMIVFLVVTVLWPLGEGSWEIKHSPIGVALLWIALGLPVLAAAADVAARWSQAGRSVRLGFGGCLGASLVLFAIAALALVLSVRTASGMYGAGGDGVRRFAALRAVHLSSGLSPVLPLCLLLAAGLWWIYHVSAGCALVDERCPRLPLGSDPQLVPLVGEDDRYVKQLLDILHPGLSSLQHYLLLIVIGGAAFVFLLDLRSPIMTLEVPLFEELLLPAGLALALAGVVGTSCKLWELWLKARRLLVALDALPLRRGFERLEGYSWKPFWRLGLASLQEFHRLLAREREALVCAMNTLPDLACFQQPIQEKRDEIRRAFLGALEVKQPWSVGWFSRRLAELKVLQAFGGSQRCVAEAAGCALNWLAGVWSREKEERPCPSSRRSELDLQVRAGERFVSMVYVNFVLVILWRIRTLVLALGGMYILLVLAMTSYPFQPKAAIDTLLIVLFGWVVAVVTMVFAQLHRDATLSHITNTTPGELGADFWVRTASFVALPLFSLVVAQFPRVNQLFASWLEPALQALQR
jgi:hypothetical protein